MEKFASWGPFGMTSLKLVLLNLYQNCKYHYSFSEFIAIFIIFMRWFVFIWGHANSLANCPYGFFFFCLETWSYDLIFPVTKRMSCIERIHPDVGKNALVSDCVLQLQDKQALVYKSTRIISRAVLLFYYIA